MLQNAMALFFPPASPDPRPKAPEDGIRRRGRDQVTVYDGLCEAAMGGKGVSTPVTIEVPESGLMKLPFATKRKKI